MPHQTPNVTTLEAINIKNSSLANSKRPALNPQEFYQLDVYLSLKHFQNFFLNKISGSIQYQHLKCLNKVDPNFEIILESLKLHT